MNLNHKQLLGYRLCPEVTGPLTSKSVALRTMLATKEG